MHWPGHHACPCGDPRNLGFPDGPFRVGDVDPPAAIEVATSRRELNLERIHRQFDTTVRRAANVRLTHSCLTIFCIVVARASARISAGRRQGKGSDRGTVSRKRRVSFTAAIVGVCVTVSGCYGTQSRVQCEYSTTLKDGFRTMGGVVVAPDTFLLWDVTGTRALRLVKNEPSVDVLPESAQYQVRAAMLGGSDTLLIVDGYEGDLVTIVSGQETRRQRLPFIPQAAAVNKRHWFLGRPESDSTYVVYAWNGSEPTTPVLKVSTPGTAQASATLSSGDSGIVASMRLPPYSVYRITTDRWHKVGDARQLTLTGDTSTVWVAVGAYGTNGEIIQVLADLGSVRRTFVYYESSGRIVATAESTMPVGMVGVSPQPDGALVLIRAGIPETLEVCRWRVARR